MVGLIKRLVELYIILKLPYFKLCKLNNKVNKLNRPDYIKLRK